MMLSVLLSLISLCSAMKRNPVSDDVFDDEPCKRTKYDIEEICRFGSVQTFEKTLKQIEDFQECFVMSVESENILLSKNILENHKVIVTLDMVETAIQFKKTSMLRVLLDLQAEQSKKINPNIFYSVAEEKSSEYEEGELVPKVEILEPLLTKQKLGMLSVLLPFYRPSIELEYILMKSITRKVFLGFHMILNHYPEGVEKNNLMVRCLSKAVELNTKQIIALLIDRLYEKDHAALMNISEASSYVTLYDSVKDGSILDLRGGKQNIVFNFAVLLNQTEALKTLMKRTFLVEQDIINILELSTITGNAGEVTKVLESLSYKGFINCVNLTVGYLSHLDDWIFIHSIIASLSNRGRSAWYKHVRSKGDQQKRRIAGYHLIRKALSKNGQIKDVIRFMLDHPTEIGMHGVVWNILLDPRNMENSSRFVTLAITGLMNSK